MQRTLFASTVYVIINVVIVFSTVSCDCISIFYIKNVILALKIIGNSIATLRNGTATCADDWLIIIDNTS